MQVAIKVIAVQMKKRAIDCKFLVLEGVLPVEFGPGKIKQKCLACMKVPFI
jgi:hypothetical protein